MRTFGLLVLLTLAAPARPDGQTMPLPDPVDDQPLAAVSSRQTAVLAGGCFWAMQELFEHVRGVITVTAGYAGGDGGTAHYDQVSHGNTGHSESVQIIYDPAKISYGKLLKIFFAAAHDPTQRNRQGPDVGTQYASRIFAVDAEQKRIAENYIRQLTAADVYAEHIATRVAMLPAFYPAEAYHQDHARRYPAPYIKEKVRRLRDMFPELYQ